MVWETGIKLAQKQCHLYLDEHSKEVEVQSYAHLSYFHFRTLSSQLYQESENALEFWSDALIILSDHFLYPL